MVWKDVEIGKKKVKDLTVKLEESGFEIISFGDEKEIIYDNQPVLIYGKSRIITLNALNSFPKDRFSKLKDVFKEFGLEKYV